MRLRRGAREHRSDRIVGAVGGDVHQHSLGTTGAARQHRNLFTATQNQAANIRVDGASDRCRGHPVVVHHDPRSRKPGRQCDGELLARAHVDRVSPLPCLRGDLGLPKSIRGAGDPGPGKRAAVLPVAMQDILRGNGLGGHVGTTRRAGNTDSARGASAWAALTRGVIRGRDVVRGTNDVEDDHRTGSWLHRIPSGDIGISTLRRTVGAEP